MMRFADMFSRIPRALLFAAAALIQVALIMLMIWDRMQILRQGTEVTLRTRPVDPRDFLRGDYVVLSYDISVVPVRSQQGPPPHGKEIFVTLVPKVDGFYEAVAAQLEPIAVSGREILIRGRVNGCRAWRPPSCEQLAVDYGLEKYFVPEGEGRDIESARNQGKVSVVAAVTPSGRAAIKRLLIDGKPVYEEPLF